MMVLIVSGGAIDERFAAGFCAGRHFDRVIAVDGGLEMADRMGLKSLTDIVGDFDTVRPDILEKYMHTDVHIHRFNPEKDYTDTDIALKLAMRFWEAAPDLEADCCLQKEDGIWILGATGSRLDHVLANITMLKLPFSRGIPAWIIDGHNKLCLLQGTMVIKKEQRFGKYVSLIPLTPEISGVTLTGVKYPLNNHTVSQGESLCVSNEITGECAVLTVQEGIAVVLETKD